MAKEPRIVTSVRCCWPKASASSRLKAPAKVISQAVATKACTGSCQRRERTEPSAQLADANTSPAEPASSPRASPPAPVIRGHSKTTIPAMPSASPATPFGDNRSPPGMTELITITHSGTDATISAVSPLETYCSDHATITLPPVSSSTPMTASRTASLRVIRSERPTRAHAASMISPEARKRDAPTMSGAMCSTATRIPRYVEPQSTYTIVKAMQTRVAEGCGEPDELDRALLMGQKEYISDSVLIAAAQKIH